MKKHYEHPDWVEVGDREGDDSDFGWIIVIIFVLILLAGKGC
jgi:hypothetical protein